MHHLKRNGRLPKVLLLAASLCLALSLGTQAQELESEPNHPCVAAQDLGFLDQLLTVNGSIDGLDIDFYRLTASPNASATARLKEGSASNRAPGTSCPPGRIRSGLLRISTPNL